MDQPQGRARAARHAGVDLDPPDGRFDLVRRAAHILRELFEQLGLPAFVKTTGSKGLHVIAPLDDEATFERGRRAGHADRRAGVPPPSRHPDDGILQKDRKGRLFVDVMRNAIGATLVAPYSLRGKPGAPLSAPIEWRELDDDALRADAIRLRDLRERLDRLGDPWHGCAPHRARSLRRPRARSAHLIRGAPTHRAVARRPR